MTWLAGFPLAMLPLWHEKHAPGAIATWEKRAPTHVTEERWQASQDSAVWTCRAGLLVVAMRLPARWQYSHRVGVPAICPPT
jgi:hypothetical protein